MFPQVYGAIHPCLQLLHQRPPEPGRPKCSRSSAEEQEGSTTKRRAICRAWTLQKIEGVPQRLSNQTACGKCVLTMISKLDIHWTRSSSASHSSFHLIFCFLLERRRPDGWGSAEVLHFSVGGIPIQCKGAEWRLRLLEQVCIPSCKAAGGFISSTGEGNFPW